MEVTFYPMAADVIIPQKATPGSVGFDLHSMIDCVIYPGQRLTVPTGVVCTQFPENTYGRIAPRSGIAVKHGIQVLAGVIDPDYRGEIKVVLHNTDFGTPYPIRKGYRIAQLIFENAPTNISVKVTDIPPLVEDTARGTGGFGSSGG